SPCSRLLRWVRAQSVASSVVAPSGERIIIRFLPTRCNVYYRAPLGLGGWRVSNMTQPVGLGLGSPDLRPGRRAILQAEELQPLDQSTGEPGLRPERAALPQPRASPWDGGGRTVPRRPERP